VEWLSRNVPANLTRALCEAAKCSATRCVAYLLARGADPHAPDPWDTSALLCAVNASDARVVRWMLAARPAALDAKITFEATAQSDPWVLAAVLEHGAPVDQPVYSMLPLALAARRGRWKHAALLLEHGARPTADASGSTPLVDAAGSGHVRCVEVLAKHEPNRLDVALLAAAEHPRVIEALVRYGANPDAIDRRGESLLHLGAKSAWASIDVHLRLARRYLAAPGYCDMTPLHYAASAGNARTIETLIAAGADLHARDYRGLTPLDRAEAACATGDHERDRRRRAVDVLRAAMTGDPR
jgi:ankyrin repeat protein